jgi:hypothetical protein
VSTDCEWTAEVDWGDGTTEVESPLYEGELDHHDYALPGFYEYTYDVTGEPLEPSAVCVPGSGSLTVEVPRYETELTTSLSGGEETGAEVTVADGTPVSDQATLEGEPPYVEAAEGEVVYTAFSDEDCTEEVASSVGLVVDGVVAPSEAATLPPGRYYWQAEYSGDDFNEPSTSACGSEVETVEPPEEAEAPAHWYSDSTRILERNPEVVAASGKLVIDRANQATVSCTVKGKDTVENPAGGGNGIDRMTDFTLSSCKAAPAVCARGEKVEVLAAGLPWASELEQGSSISDRIAGVALKLECRKGKARHSVGLLSGALAPEVGDSDLSFTAGSGELEESGASGRATVSATIKLKGPKKDTEITAASP